MASVEERIAALEAFVLLDLQPNIEGPSFSVILDSSTGTNYVDNRAFETKWMEEIDKVRQLVRKDVKGTKISPHMLIIASYCSARAADSRRGLHQDGLHLQVMLQSPATGTSRESENPPPKSFRPCLFSFLSPER